MAKSDKMKSRIIGQAQVFFGGAVRIDVGTVRDREESLAIGLSELKHPAEKVGMEPPSDETFGIQVSLVFPDLPTLSNFREILNELEAEMKSRIKEKEVDFDDVDPHHLIHQHIEKPKED